MASQTPLVTTMPGRWRCAHPGAGGVVWVKGRGRGRCQSESSRPVVTLAMPRAGLRCRICRLCRRLVAVATVDDNKDCGHA